MPRRQAFVTVGTTEFDALIRTVIDPAFLQLLAQHNYTHLLLQIGKGATQPVSISSPLNVDFYRYKTSIREDLSSSDLIIGHAGAGTCLEALELGKKLIVVINEDLQDNHQIELAAQLAEDNHLLFCVPNTLAPTFERIHSTELTPFSPGNPKLFVNWLNTYLGIKSI